MLGDLTNEVDPKDGNYITEFVSAGAKNYSFKTDKDVVKTTIKGFTLNNIASMHINFEVMRNIVQNDQEAKIEILQLTFTRNKKTWHIRSEVTKKMYGDKRVLLDDFTTYPYGYIY